MLVSLSLTAGPGIGIDRVVSVIAEYLDPAIRGETPLDAGPSLVSAEIVPRRIWLQSGRGSACPSESPQVVRVTWAGGVRLPNGEEPGDAERALYRITLRPPDDTREDVMPAVLADLVDNDNNHYLCLNTRVPAVEVSFPSGHLVDPNGDLNPDS